ncbi:MAG: Leucyl-tRNA synthetase (EC 6.1.1.4) [Olavius algarvensis spirochete endosymbiont]|nr:MAG: Leucyl-tRNA synthetase (EC 6.1.1.4) [Olavius algarvensis spirochete endosymbiont]
MFISTIYPMQSYPFREIELKWQKYWEDNKTFRVIEDEKFPPKRRQYILDMFPYPSGAGLHVGHPEGYTATDIYSRYLRMNGHNVLHPMGYDSFGLPAENYAIKSGQPPRKITEENIINFSQQIKRLGFSYDWDREIQTHRPEYYRWTQWIFLQLYKKNLAYESKMPINWCKSCKTGLANEEVHEGKCERCGHLVQRKNTRQWMLKITEYAQALLDDLDYLDWTESIKAMQRNWIGRSEGANIYFTLAGSAAPTCPIEVYTTRPDTLFGATYMVLAPEHPLVLQICTPENRSSVKHYIEQASHKSDLERTDLAKDKSGVSTGAYAINPVNGKKIPIWISDYILISYGTGAIMAVPAHDQRDWEFARKFGLPIIEVLKGGNIEKEAYTGDGPHVNSGYLNGTDKNTAISSVIAHLEKEKKGKKTINYKLRDWIFSRQRYWGEPIPLIHCPKCGIVPIPETQLPLTLPEVKSYQPTGTGESPLANIEEWVNTTCPTCSGSAKRETNTMPQWAGSCWYYLRFIDPHNNSCLVDKKKETYWMPVKLYVGGAEHAVLHLLYARFWHKVLHDIGIVSHKEPFYRLVNQGMITSFAYRRADKTLIPADEVERRGSIYVHKTGGEELELVIAKMSKSLKNVINPDDIIRDYGADSMRIYEMFMGPLEVSMPWQTKGLIGIHRFLNRIWNIANRPIDSASPPVAAQKVLHKTIKKVSIDTANLAFNTAISQMMIFINEIYKERVCWRALWEPFVLILAPYAPHLAEEMGQMLGKNGSLAYHPYPTWNDKLVHDSQKEIVLQINGKVRAKVKVPSGTDSAQLKKIALKDPKIIELSKDKEITRIVTVRDRLVNFVVS